MIWEWLYPHLTNPNRQESNKLREILNGVMKHFWPKMSFNGQNIFHVLRNQLAHSGKLPINRPKVETWMTQLANDSVYPNPGIKQYINFFDRLTQEVVLKTLGINAGIVTSNEINNFLTNGRL